MAELAGTREDPARFAKLVFNPEDDRAGLHQGQVRYTREANGQVNFLLPGNSWGKTEFIVRYSLHAGWFKTGLDLPDFESWTAAPYRILVASYNYSIAQESFERFIRYQATNPRVAALIAGINRSDSRVTLTNGTILDWGSLDGQGRLVEAVRYNLIFVDEAGHIPDLSYTYDSILYPRTMGVGGVIHFLGTPKAHSDPYLLEVYEKGRYGGDGFYFSQSGAVFENEFWPVEEKHRILRNPRYVRGWETCPDGGCDDPVCFPDFGGHAILTQMGRQVILGHFVLEGGLFFNRFAINRMFQWEGDPAPWQGDDFFQYEAQPGHLYAGAFDLGGNRLRRRKTTRGSDPTVGIVVDYTTRPWQVVYYNFIEGGSADWEDKYAVMEDVYRRFRLPYLLIDATGQLDSVGEALQSRGVEVEGITFGGAGQRKYDMLRNLQLCTEMEWGTERGALRSPPIPVLKHELEHYALPDDNIKQDTVMTLAMVAWHIAQYEMPEMVPGEVY
jgi:hypothetical protein